MNGLQIKAEGGVVHAAVPNDWHIQGSGDFDDDGKSDVLWRHDDGRLYFWEMNGLQVKTEGGVAHAAVPNDWHIQGVGDFDGDGKSDVLWRHDSGQVYFWEMNGLQVKTEGGSRTLPCLTTGIFKAAAISTVTGRATFYGVTTAGRSTSGR
jgi:hypothetical protein